MNAEILQFLEELKLNNNRVWFQNNKERYDVLRQGFILGISPQAQKKLFNRF